MRCVKIVLALILVVPGALSGQSRFGHVTNIGRIDSIASGILGETRPYLVYTPTSYGDTTVTPQSYPVLYLLDGDAHFHSVSGLVHILATGVNGTYVIPEMIVVAIPNTDRTRDLTPTPSERAPDGTAQPAFRTSGGGSNFLHFIQTELIPRVETQYRTTPYRVLVGHSFGGIAALHALYTMPQTFNAYLVIDPSLWWDNQSQLRKAKDYFSTARLDGRALYVAQANTINPDDTTSNTHFESIVQFDAILNTYNNSGIRYAYKYYADDSHGSVPLISEYDGLRFIFDGYALPLLQVIDRPAALTEHFRAVSERFGAPFQPSEGMVRQLANVALGRDTTNATVLGEMWAQLYPRSYRADEFLGDVWAARGDPARARSCYEQALVKRPENPRIRDKIAKLPSR